MLASITNGSDIGVLGIELHTRRRNRLSGIIIELDKNEMKILVKQSYGNCPQYIQARALELTGTVATKDTTTQHFWVFDNMVQSMIKNADTCFIATAYLD